MQVYTGQLLCRPSALFCNIFTSGIIFHILICFGYLYVYVNVCRVNDLGCPRYLKSENETDLGKIFFEWTSSGLIIVLMHLSFCLKFYLADDGWYVWKYMYVIRKVGKNPKHSAVKNLYSCMTMYVFFLHSLIFYFRLRWERDLGETSNRVLKFSHYSSQIFNFLLFRIFKRMIHTMNHRQGMN